MAKPAFHGQLKERPSHELLLEVYRWRLSGTLAIWPEQPRPGAVAQDRIALENGVPVRALFLDRAPNFREGLLRVMGRSRSVFAFYSEDLVGQTAGVQHGIVNVYDVLAETLRRNPRRDAIAKTLEQLARGTLRLRETADLDAFGLRPEEQAFVKLLRAAPGELRAIMRFGASHEVAARMLVLLMLVNAIEVELPASAVRAASIRPPKLETGILSEDLFGPGVYLSSETASGPRLVGSRTRRTSGVQERKTNSIPPRPLELAPGHEARWEALVALGLDLDDQDHFAVLGVTPESTEEEINAAYLERVAQNQPDALPQALSGLRPLAHRYVTRLVEAREVLTSPEERADYMVEYRAGFGSPKALRRREASERAKEAYLEAELLMLSSRWDAALVAIRDARAHDPKDPRYLAGEGWCRAHLIADPRELSEPIAMLRQALAIAPACAETLAHLGTLELRAGRLAEARDAFRSALKISPESTEARVGLEQASRAHDRAKTNEVIDFMRRRRP